MGKVIKSDRAVLPVTEPPAFQRIIKAAPKEAALMPQAPLGRVLPSEQYGFVLENAETLVQAKRYAEALQHLLDLEVSRFGDLRPHELLAEAYLQLGQIDLAKEQCAHCADIMAKDVPEMESLGRSFERLIEAAGDPVSAEKEYEELMEGEITEGSLFEGSKTALHLAAHRMNEHRYKEAEALLTAFRDRYLAAAGISE